MFLTLTESAANRNSAQQPREGPPLPSPSGLRTQGMALSRSKERQEKGTAKKGSAAPLQTVGRPCTDQLCLCLLLVGHLGASSSSFCQIEGAATLAESWVSGSRAMADIPETLLLPSCGTCIPNTG